MPFLRRLRNSVIKLYKWLLQKGNSLYLAHQPSDTKPVSKAWDKDVSNSKRQEISLFAYFEAVEANSCVAAT